MVVVKTVFMSMDWMQLFVVLVFVQNFTKTLSQMNNEVSGMHIRLSAYHVSCSVSRYDSKIQLNSACQDPPLMIKEIDPDGKVKFSGMVTIVYEMLVRELNLT